MNKERTNLSKKEFSRSAPMQPANPRMNITPPTTRKSQTGSKPPRSVMDEMLDRTPWRGETEDNNTLRPGQAAAPRSGATRVCQKGHSDIRWDGTGMNSEGEQGCMHK